MAQPTQPLTRSAEDSDLRDLEGPFWLVHAIIIALGGFAAGAVVTLGRFDDPRILSNGWFQLSSVGVGVIALSWIVERLRGRTVRRLQVCLILSLLAHTALGAYLKDRYVLIAPLGAGEGNKATEETQFEFASAPEYYWQHIDGSDAPQRGEDSVTEAVKVPIPDQLGERGLTRQTLPPDQLASSHREIPDWQQPGFPELRRAEVFSAPNPSDALGGAPPARQDLQQRLGPQSAAEPQAAAREQSLSNPLRPQAAQAERRRQDVPLARTDSLRNPAAAELPTPLEPTRRVESAQPLPAQQTNRTRIEKANDVAQVPQLPSEIPTVSAAQEPPAWQPEAREATANRQAISAATSGIGTAGLPATVATTAPLPESAGATGRRALGIAPLPGTTVAAPGQLGRSTDSSLSGALATAPQVEVPSLSPGDAPPRATSVGGSPAEALRPSAGPSTGDGGLLGRQTGVPPVAAGPLAGPSGVDVVPEAMINALERRSAAPGEAAQPVPERLAVERSDGSAAMEHRLREMAKEAFRQRDPHTRGQAAQAHGGSVETERAVEMGLDYLARHQFPDGHWSVDRFPAGGAGYENAGPGQMNADTAGTGLALLAFLGAGYTHREQKYRSAVASGLGWLVAHQQTNGQLFTDGTDQTVYSRMYGHGIATIALCEAYGMTKDPALRGPAQKAIRFIVEAQNPARGGWRYHPRLESDTSVSGWQLMALRSGQMAGLDVPADTVQKVGRWLDLAQAAGGSRYRYNPYAADTPEQRQGRSPNRTMTAEGLLMRMYMGWQRDNAALVEGAEFLKANLPENGQKGQWLRDAYYWYYATQVMFHMQGSYWTAWNEQLRAVLENTQVESGPLAGSWDPNEPVPDRWAHAAGRHYVTCLDLLMLEVYYRYLPLYKTLVK